MRMFVSFLNEGGLQFFEITSQVAVGLLYIEVGQVIVEQ